MQRRDGTVSGSTFSAASGATPAHPNAQAPQHEVYAAGHLVAGLSETGFINVRDGLTGFSNSRSGTQNYRVQAGDTLQSIAQRVYGNGALWYVIADANALSASPTSATLTPGLSLQLPQVTSTGNTAHTAHTFKPYNPQSITGTVFIRII